MEGFDPAIFSCNPFRVLGLEAGATQTQIDAAARAMRIWPDAALIPATPFDHPELGELARSRMAIEKAVSQLHNPPSRLNSRLFWFTNNGAAERDRALNRLALVCIGDADFKNTAEWSAALGEVARATLGSDYKEWFEQVEAAGDFEKKADAEEIAAAIDGFNQTIASALSFQARRSLDLDQFESARAIYSVIRSVLGAERTAKFCGKEIGDRVEDLLTARCRNMQNAIANDLNWDRAKWKRNARKNRKISVRLQREIDLTIEPLFGLLAIVAEADPVRSQRVAPQAARMFRNMGLAWARSRKDHRAAASLHRAARFAWGTSLTAKIEEDLRIVSKKTRKSISGIGVACLVIYALGLLAQNNGNSIPSNNPVIPSYNFENPPPIPGPQFPIGRPLPQPGPDLPNPYNPSPTHH